MEAQTQARLGQIQTRIRELEGSALGDIVRDSSGRVRHMNQYDAERYCREQGTRLPRARELAAYSQSLGACGILSPSAYENFEDTGNCRKSDYYRVRVAASATEPADDFYFNKRGYQRPAGDLGDYWFWSSSVPPYDSIYAYSLNGRYGSFAYVRSLYRDSLAVRCVRSR